MCGVRGVQSEACPDERQWEHVSFGNSLSIGLVCGVGSVSGFVRTFQLWVYYFVVRYLTFVYEVTPLIPSRCFLHTYIVTESAIFESAVGGHFLMQLYSV